MAFSTLDSRPASVEESPTLQVGVIGVLFCPIWNLIIGIFADFGSIAYQIKLEIIEILESFSIIISFTTIISRKQGLDF